MSRLWFEAAIRRFALAVVLCVLAGGPALAQSTGRVEGIVTDSTGAVLPGVTVTATNKGTNVGREATTGADGGYTITPLSLGSYLVKCSLSGFKEATTKLNLAVNQVARLDFKLEIGGQAESVEVTGVAPLIDKSTSFIGSVIDRQQVEDLPLNGRNFTQLATLSPGVTRGTPGSVAGGGQSGTDAESFRYAENGGGALSANGLREQFNNFMLDGFDNNESLVNAIAYFPSPEAVQEFRVITTNAPAEFGRAGGAVTSIVTRSGSNEPHGSVYEFNRAKGLAATPTFAQEKPEFSQNDFGATLGGPLVKDKTFFFVSYHGLRSKIPVEAGGRVTVPTAKMRNGDFSESLNPGFTGLGRPIIIADPNTGIPYPGNIIPPSQIDSVGRAYLNLYPLPDLGDRAQQNYFTHREKESTFNDFDARIDHNFSAGDTLFVRGSLWRDRFSDPGRIPGFQAGFGAGTSNHRGFNLGVGETHTFSANLINELRIGYVDFKFEFLPVGFGTDQNAAIGIPGIAGITTASGISLIGGGNGSFIEYLGDFGQYVVGQKAYQLSDAVTWLRGRHNLKFGGTLLLRELRFERTRFGKGFYFFSDQTAPSAGRSGYEVSDMLVGRTSFTTTATPGFVPKSTRSWENAIFVQDDLRATQKLTLNLGLRWEVLSPYYEVDDKLANFDPASGTLVLPGANGAPRSTVDTDFNNFGPRIGFAYQANDKTVVRGGWGLYYSLDRGGIDNQLTENPPATVTEFRFGGPGSAVRLSEPIPLPSQVDPNNPALPDGSALVFIPRDNPTTRVQQFNVGVQRELTSNTAIMLAYVGTRGSNLTAVLTSAGFSGAITGRLTTVANVGSSNYDSLQVTLRRNLSSGLAYLAAYTLGHARDNTTGPFPGPQSVFLPSDSNNLDKDEGDSNFDVRHRFTWAGTYELPFAKENALLGGWAVNAIVTLAKGTPFTVFSNGRRTNVSGDPNDGPKTAEEWFATSVFSPAPDGQLGNEERNAVRAPGIKTIDLSLFKSFKLGSRAGLELRVEGFNVLNTPQYGFPNQFLGDANFGRITTTRQNSERQVQLAARVTF